jgi:hypothetical protein
MLVKMYWLCYGVYFEIGASFWIDKLALFRYKLRLASVDSPNDNF